MLGGKLYYMFGEQRQHAFLINAYNSPPPELKDKKKRKERLK
jgi:hypothetical protein